MDRECEILINIKEALTKIEIPQFGTFDEHGGGVSDRKGWMSQPTFLVREIWFFYGFSYLCYVALTNNYTVYQHTSQCNEKLSLASFFNTCVWKSPLNIAPNP